MQLPAAASRMFPLLVAVLALSSAFATVAPVEFSVLEYGSTHVRLNDKLTNQGNKPVQSVTAAEFRALDHGIDRTPSTTEVAARSRIRLQVQDDRVFSDRSDHPVLTVTVDKSGKGNYTTIQEAINAVPVPGNIRTAAWVVIKIMPGTYSEKVVVDKSKISLIGTSGASSTVVTWSGKWTKDDSATLYVVASDFVARGITFQNTYGRSAQAIAARVSGDRVAFYGCRFLSYQDTIMDDNKGRHYYSDCYVEGATDFIFGAGKAFFEKCHLHSISTEGGAFTAQGRESESDSTGFSFVDCNLTGVGVGRSILGRPWRPYARVMFARSSMSNTVNPVGWNNWNDTKNERTAFFGQFECYGEGSRTEDRAYWTHNHLSPAEAKPFLTKEAWLDGKDWIKV